ncbi:GrpB family protein [Nocardioides sp. 503]|uniref:GrpB family protein n=1 Tax=Nocardioides sp. 503 TaxID=2508326 RepID=UPI00106FF8AD|nr:GrpB family protein [Nocardioides sp. 503]
MPTAAEIVRHHHDSAPPGADPWVPPHRQTPYEIEVADHDTAWPASFAEVDALVRGALGARVLELHHVGSTSVPGLPAKPVIDVDLVVAEPADEAAYLPALVAAGFVHTIREPWWHEHRLLVLAAPRAYLHVFGPDCPEVVRHLMFRDWLVAHPEDRDRYAAAKREAAVATNAVGGHGMDYNRHKSAVVREIYERMFRAHGLIT